MLSLSENIAKSFRGLLFLTHTVCVRAGEQVVLPPGRSILTRTGRTVDSPVLIRSQCA